MPEHQGPRRHSAVKIVVHGLAGKEGDDVTSKLHPYLISVQIIDTLENGNDECHIELDDRNAELKLPPDNVSLQVSLGWAGEGPRIPDRGRTSALGGQGSIQMTDFEREQEMPWGGPGMELLFNGWVSEVESGFGRRSGGRRVWITGTSGNVLGLAKQTDIKSWGEGKKEDASKESGKGGAAGGAGAGTGGAGSGVGEIPLMKVLTEAFQGSGLSVKLSPEMLKIKRGYWAMNGSPMDFAREIAKNVGGVMKIAGGVVTIVGKGEGVNGDGIAMETVEAVWGVNLIGWRIKPYAGRPQWGKSEVRHFNLMDAEWFKESLSIGGGTPFGGAKAINMFLNPASNETDAAQTNMGQSSDSESRRGTGWILINGEPRAKANGHIVVVNARPGVDGKYLMTEVEHNYTRGVGYTTRVNVQYPEPIVPTEGWTNDPGTYNPDRQPKAIPQGPPLLSESDRYLPEEQKALLRKWYEDRNEEVPPILYPLEQMSDPAPLTMSPEQLQTLRNATEEALQQSIDDVLGRGVPQGVP